MNRLIKDAMKGKNVIQNETFIIWTKKVCYLKDTSDFSYGLQLLLKPYELEEEVKITCHFLPRLTDNL